MGHLKSSATNPHSLWPLLPPSSKWMQVRLGSRKDRILEVWELLVVALIRLEWIYALDQLCSMSSPPLNTRAWQEGWKDWGTSLRAAGAVQETDGVTLRLEFNS